jgi:hypothetical protein
MIESKTIKISRSYKLFDYKNSIFRHFMLENIPPKSWEQRVTKEQHEYRIDQCPAHQRSKIKQCPTPNAKYPNTQIPNAWTSDGFDRPFNQKHQRRDPFLSCGQGVAMDWTIHSTTIFTIYIPSLSFDYIRFYREYSTNAVRFRFQRRFRFRL